MRALRMCRGVAPEAVAMRPRSVRRERGFGRLTGASALCLVLAGAVAGQDGPRARLGLSATPPPNVKPQQPEMLGPPSAASPSTPDDIAANAIPISLPAAIRLAQTSNLEIAQAREVVSRARAGLDRARVMILP